VRLADDDQADTLYLFQRHHWLVAEWHSAGQALTGTPEGLLVPASGEQVRQRRRSVARELEKLRAEMRDLELLPPPLPPGLAEADVDVMPPPTRQR
jgi:hypothetical protein